jgi:hypothetical protein
MTNNHVFTVVVSYLFAQNNFNSAYVIHVLLFFCCFFFKGAHMCVHVCIFVGARANVNKKSLI